MKKCCWLILLVSLLAACKQTQSVPEQASSAGVVSTEQIQNSALIQAFEQKKRDIFVEGQGEVKKLLPDDNKGARHQKFLVTISDRQTLLFAHNVDLAPSVPVKVGDTIQFRGEYIYNPKGGVLHWTHRDPQAKTEGGWIKLNGQLYH